MSNAGAAVVAGAAAAVATGGNGRSPRIASGVAAVAPVAAASGDGGERASAAEPFAWLWARRRGGEEVAAEVEARAAYLLRFAQEAFVALSERDFDPIEAAESAPLAAGPDDQTDT
jgi:hypothetical protein